MTSKGEKGDKGNTGMTGPVGPNAAAGDPGRKGDTGRVGDSGRTGDTGDTGRGVRGYAGERGLQGEIGKQGLRGEPGVTSTLTITQLDAYVKRLERRYRNVSRLLIAGLITMAFVFTVAGAVTVGEFRAQREQAILGICTAINEQSARIVGFRETVDPETAKLARETFSEIDCPAEIELRP